MNVGTEYERDEAPPAWLLSGLIFVTGALLGTSVVLIGIGLTLIFK